MADDKDTATQAAPEGDTAAKPAKDAASTEGAKQETTETTDAAKPDGEKPAEKPKRTPWYTQRIDELTRQKHEERRRAESLQVALEHALTGTKPETAATAEEAPAAPAKPAAPLPPSEVEKRAAELVAAREFNAKCDQAYEAGTKEFPNFQESVDTLKALGAMEPAFVESIVSTDAPAKVLQHLGQNPEEAQRIMALPLRRQVIELDRIANAKAPAKPVSATPAPVKPVGGSARSSQDLRDDDTMDDWVAKRMKQKEASR